MDKAKSLQTRIEEYEQDGENDRKILEEKRNDARTKLQLLDKKLTRSWIKWRKRSLKVWIRKPMNSCKR